MRVRLLLAAVLFLRLAVPAGAQVIPNTGPVPDFTVTVQGTFDAETLAEFNRRLDDYTALRTRLEAGLSPLTLTINPDEIETFERRLARRLRDARGSWRGQLFTPSMEGQLKRMLDVYADPATVAAIMDDSPTEFDIDVNETYSKKRPLATMPPKLLLLLPDLPPDVEYRFVGRHFIIRDVRANIILDEIPFALRCRDCVSDLADEEEEEDEKAAVPEDVGAR